MMRPFAFAVLVLSACSLTPVLAAQPFTPPSDDASYNKDIRDDRARVETPAPMPAANPVAPSAPATAAEKSDDDVQYADNGQVKFASGGVDDDGMQSIDIAQNNYTLKMTFVGTGGMYLADVDVQITDRSGHTLLSAVTSGPVLLAQLPPGTYTLKATAEGVAKTQRISVGKRRLSTYYMRFPTTES